MGFLKQKTELQNEIVEFVEFNFKAKLFEYRIYDDSLLYNLKKYNMCYIPKQYIQLLSDNLPVLVVTDYPFSIIIENIEYNVKSVSISDNNGNPVDLYNGVELRNYTFVEQYSSTFEILSYKKT